MNTPRTPRSRFYDGRLYGWFLDPLLGGLHALVAKQVPDGCRVLDAACGTGDLALRLAPRSAEVVGVELSPRHVAFAQGRVSRRGVDNVRFEVADASHLAHHADGAFDVATIMLALHEMPTEARVPVMRELARVAERVLLVDFAVPMPWNPAGLRNRALEIGAGPEHFAGFRDFSRRGGLPALSAEAGLTGESERAVDGSTLQMMWVRRS